MQTGFETGFEKVRSKYRSLLEVCIRHSRIFTICFFAACIASFGLFPWLGQDFFPAVDSGQFRLHVRARTGTRIEETAKLCDLIENSIREVIPQNEVTNILDNIGLPYSGINTSYSNSGVIGPADADIQVSLAEKHRPTAEYLATLRATLQEQFPGVTFYFLPSDMVSQILNFGLPAPIDVQIVGANLNNDREFADRLLQQMKYIPGATDLRIQQPFNQPKLFVDIDRTKSQQVGYTRARYRWQCAGIVERKFSDSAHVLAESPQRSQLQHRGPITAVRNGFSSGPQERPYQRERHQLRRFWRVWLRSNEVQVWPRFPTTTLRRSIDIYGAVQGTDLGERVA